MKVLDLQCADGHTFEGWFASEQDFQSQWERALVQCPVCGNASIHKMLSAPRLNLSGAKSPEVTVEQPEAQRGTTQAAPLSDAPGLHPDVQQALYKAVVQVAKHVLTHTDDVGSQFAEEARRMHYGEAPERGIRGQTTSVEALELREEGIDVMPLLLPEHLKKPLQ